MGVTLGVTLGGLGSGLERSEAVWSVLKRSEAV